jgi:predicted ATP-dependent serine protease
VRNPKNSNLKGLVQASDLLLMRFETLTFAPPWSDLIGEQPARNSYIAVWGMPGSGKSTLCFQLAGYLANFGDVLYVATEEKIHETLRLKAESVLLDNDNVYFVSSRKISEIDKYLSDGNFDFVIIDSLNKLNITPQDFEAWKEKHKDKMLIAVLQSTKNGSFRGSQEFAHDSDVVISVNEGVATTDKGRFGRGTYQIFNE